jgi:hypothetical protein
MNFSIQGRPARRPGADERQPAMNSSEPSARFRYCLLTECEICRHLADEETSFTKWGWEEMDRSMPAEAGRLEPAAASGASGNADETVLRCPECGSCYLYSSSSEYLANGSEDEATLTRVSPTRVRTVLSEEEHSRLVEAAGRGLDHAAAVNRRHAARCLTAWHLERAETEPVRRFLASSDIEWIRGALFCLRTFLQRGHRPSRGPDLLGPLQALAGHTDEEIALVAPYLIRLMAKSPEGTP